MTTQEPIQLDKSEKRKIYYQKNREHILARQREYNINTKEARSEYFKCYYKQNKEKINQRCMERSKINYWKDVHESRLKALQYFKENYNRLTAVRRIYQEENRAWLTEIAREHNKKYRLRTNLKKNGAVDIDNPIGESLVVVKLNPIVVFD